MFACLWVPGVCGVPKVCSRIPKKDAELAFCYESLKKARRRNSWGGVRTVTVDRKHLRRNEHMRALGNP